MISLLAQQFDDTKWTEQGYNTPRVKEWTPDEVYAWAKKIDGISDEVAIIFVENDIIGNELLALTKDGLIELGITRTGTWCLLLEEIKKLKQGAYNLLFPSDIEVQALDTILSLLSSWSADSQDAMCNSN